MSGTVLRGDLLRRLWSAAPRAVPSALFGVVVGLLGRRTPAILLGVLAVLLFCVGVLAPGRARRFDRRVETVGRLVGRSVSLTLAAIAWVLILLPTWTASTFTRHSPISAGRDDATGAWVPAIADSDGADVHRSAGREHRVGRAMRWRGHLRAAPLVALLVVVAWFVTSRDVSSPLSSAEPMLVYNGVPVDAATFQGEPWAAELLASEAQTWMPDAEIGWINGDATSRYVNVVDGSRRTLQIPEPELTIWMFGGSTTFGIGQRDEHTIASELVRLAAERGMRLDVVNHGVSGHVNWQQTLLFGRLLASDPPPDLALFLDGANERALAYERVQYGLLEPEVRAVRPVSAEDRSELAEDARRRGYRRPADAERVAAALMAEQYEEGLSRAVEWAGERGFPVEHFWQPEICDVPPDRPGVSDVKQAMQVTDEDCANDHRLVDRVLARLEIPPRDLRDVFDEVDRPTFFDHNHTNEFGARVVAAAILDRIWPQLVERRDQS